MATSEIKTQIQNSLTQGDPLQLDYDTIIKAADNPDNDLLAINVDLGIKLPSFDKLAGLFGGKSSSNLLGGFKLPTSGVSLKVNSVGFVLATKSKVVSQVSATIGFTGATLDLPSPGKNKLELVLDSISFTWSGPGTTISLFMATINGKVTLGSGNDALVLDATVNFPGGLITLDQAKGQLLPMGKFFGDLGLPDNGILDEVSLSNLDLVIGIAAGSFAMSGTLSPTKGDAIDLWKGHIAIRELTFGLSYIKPDLSGYIGASFSFMETLILDVRADMKPDAWEFSGNIDIQGTAQALKIKPKNDGSYAVPVGVLVAKLFPSIGKLPKPLSDIFDIEIEYLLIDYTYQKGGTKNNEYKFNCGLKDSWEIGGKELDAEVSISLSNTKRTLEADFTMDGFEFDLSCEFDTTKSISISITDEIEGQKLEANGTYTDNATANPPTRTASLSIKSLPSLGNLMTWFVKKVTKNPYFVLPEPWSTLLNDIDFTSVLKGLTFEMEIVPPHGTVKEAKKSFSCILTPSAKSKLFDIGIKNFTLTYTSDTQPGESGLSFGFELEKEIPFLGLKTVSWDPVNEQPPSVPGKGASVIDIKLLALGQHTTFNKAAFKPPYVVPPQNVEQAVADTSYAVLNESKNPAPMQFAKDYGWLVGAHALFLGQADVKMIFYDPEMYGISIDVKSGKNATLNLLAGLKAEILYKKVSPTVGEYEGFLTLPSKIQKMQFGVATITLPSISVSIYTNGDFGFNVGFPYNLDFSHSMSVTAEGYTGAGGFYFAKLNGLHPKGLPDATNGNFNPITEVGVGLKVGRAISFNKGPLRASASISLEAMFQGLFAKFSSSDGKTDGEFYLIHAAVELIGHIEGEINFVIIQASLSVTAFIRVDAILAAHEASVVLVSAGIRVAITVKINLGLFSIHVHCHFSTTFKTHATLGHKSDAPWKVNGANSMMLDEADSIILSATGSAPLTWQPITATSSLKLNIDVLPQPTATGTGQWFYVCQFGFDLDEEKNDSFANLAQGLLVWTLYALTNPSAGSTYDKVVGTKSGDSTPITLDQVKTFIDALHNDYDSVAPSMSSVQLLFKPASGTSLFEATVKPASKPAKQYKAAFFPAIPGTSVEISLSTDSTQKQVDPPAISDPIKSEQQKLFIEFLMIAVSNALDKTEALGAYDDNGNSTVFDILEKLESSPSKGEQSYLDSIAGLTTRFMLHGTRYNSAALYQATGQQQAFTPKSTDKSLCMNIQCKEAASMGIQFDSISICSAASGKPDTLIWSPDHFLGSTAPTLNTNEYVGIEYMPLAHDPVNMQYAVKVGIAVNSKSSLWQLPKSLLNDLSSGTVSPTDCALMVAPVDPKTGIIDNTGKAVTDAQYIMSVDFAIKKIPLPTSSCQKAGFVKDTYQLGPVNQLGLLRLEQLILDIATDPIKSIQLSYETKGQISFSNVDGESLFMLQSNFSTASNPPTLAATPTVSPDFIYKLWTGGITNDGGYYLYWTGDQAIPEASFDSNGVAAVSLVVTLSGLKSYTTGIVLDEALSIYSGKDKTKHLYVENDKEKVIKAYFKPGKVPMRMKRVVPIVKDPVPFSEILNNLYNLIAANCYGGDFKTLNPKNQASTSSDENWNYDQLFSPIPDFKADKSGIPPEAMNPYQNIIKGSIPIFTVKPLDLFGNEWASFTPKSVPTNPLGYNDPVISLKHLPYLHVDYSFDDSGNMLLFFEVDFQGYGTKSGQPSIDNRPTDLWAYAQAIYQLSDPKVIATVSTNFASKVNSDSVISHILSNLKLVYEGLDTNAPITTLPVITVSIDQSSLNTATFFPLEVELTLERTAFVDPAFAGDPNVTKSCIVLSPHTQVASNANETDLNNDLKPMVRIFEKAYVSQSLKLTVGAIDQKGVNPNAHQLWVVKFGKTGTIDIDFVAGSDGNPVCYPYSPKPLSNRLLSRANVPVTKSDGSTGTVTATNVDLDSEMRSFLKALDSMFTPEKMVPASLINSKAIKSLATSKQTIAQKLLSYLTFSPNDTGGTDGALAAAKELYLQKCLKELSNFYKMDAVAVFETAVNKNLDDELNFLGTPIPSNETGVEATLTTGKAGIANKTEPSYVPIGIFPKQSDTYDTYDANLSFQVTALEHNLNAIKIDTGGSKPAIYETGSWLKFVLPPEVLTVGTKPITVPMPLRSFPTPPVLGKQYARDLANIYHPAADADEEMMYAKGWSLNGDYKHKYMVQDSLGVEVDLNLAKLSNALLNTSNGKDLFEALVQFRTEYPSLKEKLDTLSSSDMSNATELSKDLDSFAALVSSVAGNDWPDYASKLTATAKSSFRITEYEGDKNSWNAKVESLSKNEFSFLPQLEIPGYETTVLDQSDLPNSVTYNFSPTGIHSKTPDELTSRTVNISPAESLIKWPLSGKEIPFNILTHQSGLLSLKTMRNMSIAKDFHLETSYVQYKNVLFPQLTTDAAIDIGQMRGKASLSDQLDQLFKALLLDYSSGTEQIDGQFQLVVSFNYPSNLGVWKDPNDSKGALESISVPLMMRPPTDFSDKNFKTEIATTINDWINLNYGSLEKLKSNPNLADAFLNFDISLYSGDSNSGNPVLRIERAELKIADITS